MIYLDNSSTTYPKPKNVLDNMVDIMNSSTSPNRGISEMAIESSKKLYTARKKIADFYNMNNPLNVAFTSGATESMNLIINSLLQKDDHVIVTPFEHNSTLRPLNNLGINYSEMNIYNNEIDYNFESLLNNKTKAFICCHSSNILGNTINIKKIREFTKMHNLIFILDTAQSSGQIKIDIENVDILTFTGHKYLFGLPGTGGICINNKYDFKNTKTGGTGSHSLSPIHPTSMPEIFEAGTMNYLGIFSFINSLDFINKIGIDTIHQIEIDLCHYLYNKLKIYSDIKIYGDFNDINRSGILSFNIKNIDSNDVAVYLYNNYDIIIRSGFHCCPNIHKHINTLDQGVCRVSFSYFNTTKEIDILCKGIEKILESSG